MKKLVLFIVLTATSMAFSQQKNFENEVKKISNKITQITKEEKDALKLKVKKINERYENGELTKQEAQILKKNAAAYHAQRIEERVSFQEKKLRQLVQDKTNGRIASIPDDEMNYSDDNNTFRIGNKRFKLSMENSVSPKKQRSRIANDLHPRTGKPFKNKRQRDRHLRRAKREFSRVTTSYFIFSMGVNNVIENDLFSSLDNSQYDFWRSHMYEVGWTWKSRFTRKPSKLYLKYGVSFLWNNLRAINNQFHEYDVTTNQVSLVTHSENLTESRFRHSQVIFPIYLELDFSKNSYYSNGRSRDRRNNSFRVGFGGFAGFKLGVRQYLEYLDTNGHTKTEVVKDDFNTNIFNYGVGANIGYGSTSIFMKYDLNPLFKDSETRNISFGVRLEL